MSLERTQQTMNRYFEGMGRGGDVAEFYTADVTWTTTDTGQDVRGASPVRDFIVALHNDSLTPKTRRSVVSDEHAYLEGDCPNAPIGTVAGSLIAAMRCYGPIVSMCP
jgi:hypothetical protein